MKGGIRSLGGWKVWEVGKKRNVAAVARRPIPPSGERGYEYAPTRGCAPVKVLICVSRCNSERKLSQCCVLTTFFNSTQFEVIVFAAETTLNKFLMSGLTDIMADIPEDRIYERCPGNGHPPVWVLGHLAICAELGQKLCGGTIEHMAWLPAFGPGSSDEITDEGRYSTDEFMSVITNGYSKLAELAANTSADVLNQPHGVELLNGSALVTVGDVLSHLLSSHFAFHIAQLSAWRRAAGHSALF